MSQPFIGEIKLVGFSFAPVGYAACAGQLMAIAQNTALFSLLGTTYGGDGVTTFALPDLRGRAALHMGTLTGGGTYSLGESGGAEQVTLTGAQLPSHTHAMLAQAGGTSASAASGAVPASGGPDLYATSSGTSMPPTGATGGNQPHDNMAPFLAMNFVIALVGIFPARN
ncbi:MAG: phage tail protein [Rudaea sp.]